MEKRVLIGRGVAKVKLGTCEGNPTALFGSYIQRATDLTGQSIPQKKEKDAPEKVPKKTIGKNMMSINF